MTMFGYFYCLENCEDLSFHSCFLQMNVMRLSVGFHAWMVPVIFMIRDVIKSDNVSMAKMKWDVSQLFSL